jgi:hypothetical protein
MTKYLNPIEKSRHHDVVAHILGTDGVTALCVEKSKFRGWPRVCDGEWEIGDAPHDDQGACVVCSRCLARQKRLNSPPVFKPKAPTKEKLAEIERRRLEKWNAAARERLPK